MVRGSAEVLSTVKLKLHFFIHLLYIEELLVIRHKNFLYLRHKTQSSFVGHLGTSGFTGFVLSSLYSTHANPSAHRLNATASRACALSKGISEAFSPSHLLFESTLIFSEQSLFSEEQYLPHSNINSKFKISSLLKQKFSLLQHGFTTLVWWQGRIEAFQVAGPRSVLQG